MEDSKSLAEKPEELKKSSELEAFRLGEIGNVGLNISNGRVFESLKKDLTFPQSNKTYKLMAYDSTIASALGLFQLMLARSKWDVKAPVNATPEQKKKAEFIRQCMRDMEHSWIDFIQEAASMVQYGFSVHEKVYRKRTRANGSRYNDGLIGWKKLPIRSQDSIEEFKFTKDHRDIKGVVQKITTEDYTDAFKSNYEIAIPKSKILLFRTGKSRNNPYGTSALRSVYYSWKYRTTLEEVEAIGVQRDLAGVPVLKIPPQYMSADATPEQKAIYAYYKNMVRNLQQNQQAGLVIPNAYDPETKMPLFEFKLLSQEGGKSYNTNEIVNRYDKKILIALGADLLALGTQGTSGSYALGTIKSGILSLTVEARLQEIADVLNSDLIPQTFKLNGWTDEEFPEIYFDELDAQSLEEVSKFVQRTSSVGMLTKDHDTINMIRNTIGLDDVPEDADLTELLGENTSRAGDGMAKGSGNGTSDEVAGKDNSADNSDNTA